MYHDTRYNFIFDTAQPWVCQIIFLTKKKKNINNIIISASREPI